MHLDETNPRLNPRFVGRSMKTQTQSSRFCILNGGPSRYQEQRKNSKELHGPRGWDSLVCYKKKAKVCRVGKRGEGSGTPRMVPCLSHSTSWSRLAASFGFDGEVYCCFFSDRAKIIFLFVSQWFVSRDLVSEAIRCHYFFSMRHFLVQKKTISGSFLWKSKHIRPQDVNGLRVVYPCQKYHTNCEAGDPKSFSLDRRSKATTKFSQPRSEMSNWVIPWYEGVPIITLCRSDCSSNSAPSQRVFWLSSCYLVVLLVSNGKTCTLKEYTTTE